MNQLFLIFAVVLFRYILASESSDVLMDVVDLSKDDTNSHALSKDDANSYGNSHVCEGCHLPYETVEPFTMACGHKIHAACLGSDYVSSPEIGMHRCSICGHETDFFDFIYEMIIRENIPISFEIPERVFHQKPGFKKAFSRRTTFSFGVNHFRRLIKLKVPLLKFGWDKNFNVFRCFIGTGGDGIEIHFNESGRAAVDAGLKPNEIFLFDLLIYGCDLIDPIVREINSVFYKNDRNTTFLHLALRAKNLYFIRHLLERGSSANIESEDFGLPLHQAIRTKNIEIVRLILKFGGDPNLECKGRVHPLVLAVKSKFYNCLDALFEYGASTSYHPQNASLNLLHVALIMNGTEAVKIMIRNGYSFMTLNGGARFMLHFTVFHDNYELLKILISKGANLMEPSSENLNAIILRKHPQFASFIVVSDPAAVHAVVFDRPKILELFLTSGLCPNIRISNGKSTLLHLACELKRIDCIKTLIAHGADTRALNSDGRSAISSIMNDPQILDQVLNWNIYLDDI